MTEEQAKRKAEQLNRGKYRDSRISVKPMKYGNSYILVGVPKQ